MTYKIKVAPQHEREALIAKACASAVEFSTFHEYQNAAQKLPVVRLPIELPIYRMANGRTRTEQLKYIREHKHPSDYFSSGQENQGAQQAQHGILYQFAKQGTPSITPIATVLAKGKQTEPLLITSAGLIINGNRRGAAMRELYDSSDTLAAQGYSHVNCLVLPTAITDKEIKEIEIRLQMQPETKLPYTWVNEALTIKDLMSSGFTPDQIGQDMRKTQPEIAAALTALTHAEIYLKDWKRQSEEYDLVEGAKQLFGDMAKLLKNKSGEDLEISRRLAYVIQDNSKQLKDRAYDFNFSFGKKSDEVAEALAVRLGIDLTSPISEKQNVDRHLEIDLDDETEGATFKPLIEALDDPSRRSQIVEALIAVCESIKSSEQDEKRGQAALRAIQDANTKLLQVDLSMADPGTYSAMIAQLDSVMTRAGKLKEQLVGAGGNQPSNKSN